LTSPCPAPLGELVLLEVQKQSALIFPNDDWYPAKVQVISPEGNLYNIPMYTWITDDEVYMFREGKALTVLEDKSNLGKYAREQELERQQKAYRWHLYKEGLPYCMKVKDLSSLPPDACFSFTKETDFAYNAAKG
ncbi:hypothetical protein LDENG_00017940, partial [Lucifuga dentata]